MRLRIVVRAVVVILLASSIARARDLIQMDFDGVVTQPGITFGVSLVLGDPLHARVVFDTDSPDHNSSPLVGHYQYEFMEVFTNRGLVIRTGQSPPGSLNALLIDRSIEEFSFVGSNAVHDDNIVAVRFPLGTFATDRPPTSLPFAMATEAQYSFRRVPAGVSARAALTSYSTAVVPEPIAGMTALAVGALALARRRGVTTAQ